MHGVDVDEVARSMSGQYGQLCAGPLEAARIELIKTVKESQLPENFLERVRAEKEYQQREMERRQIEAARLAVEVQREKEARQRIFERQRLKEIGRAHV